MLIPQLEYIVWQMIYVTLQLCYVSMYSAIYMLPTNNYLGKFAHIIFTASKCKYIYPVVDLVKNLPAMSVWDCGTI